MERLGRDIFGSLPGKGGRNAFEKALRVRKIWVEALGRSLAGELRPGMVDGECLDIFTSSSAWLTEARFLESRILRALKKADPGLGIRKTRIRLDKGASAPPSGPVVPRPTPPERPLDETERERIRDMVREVRDPELRDRLARLFEKAAARQERAEVAMDGADLGDERE